MRGLIEVAAGLVVLLVVALFLLWPPSDAPVGVMISANGVLDQHWPWRALAATPREPRWTMNDPALQVAPWRVFMRREFEAGRLPVWNHLNGFGAPFLANPQTRTLYPLQWLFLLGEDADSAAFAFHLIHVLLGAVGLFLLGRRLGLAPIGATFAALTFAAFGFNPHWLLWPQHSTLAWLPLVLLAADRLRERASIGRFVVLAALLAISLLAGHPETCFKGGVTLLIFQLAREAGERRAGIGAAARRLLVLGAALGAALLLAAPQLLPFLAYLRDSEALVARAAAPAFPPHPDLASFLRGLAAYLAQLASPDAFGDGRGPGRYWFPEGNHNELAAAHLGATALLLLPFGLRRRTALRLPMTVVAGFAVAVALRLPVFYDLLILLPGFGLGMNSRFLAIAGLALALLAGAGLDRLLDPERADGSGRGLLGPFILVALVVAAYLFSQRGIGPGPEAPAGLRGELLLRDGILLAASLAVVVLLVLLRRGRSLLLVALAVVVLADLQHHSRAAIPWCAHADAWPRPPVIEFLARTARPEAGRIAAIEEAFGDLDALASRRRRSFPAETNLAYDLALLDSYSALQPLAEHRFTELAKLPVTANGKLSLAWANPGAFDDRLLDLAGLRWLLVPGDWSAQAKVPAGTEFVSADGRRYRQLYAGKDGLVLERPTALPRAFLVFAAKEGDLEDLAAADLDPRVTALVAGEPPRLEPGTGRVEILTLRADLMELDVTLESGRALLVTTDLDSESFQADAVRLDPGADSSRARAVEIIRCNGIFRAVVIDGPGRHRVRFRTRVPDAALAGGLALALLAALGILVAGLGCYLRRRRSTS